MSVIFSALVSRCSDLSGEHYNQSTGGLHCKTVTMEMIDSRRHFKASLQPHKPRLDLNTTAPPRTKTQIPIRENRYGLTYSVCGSDFMGLMFSMMNQFLSVNTHAALLLSFPLTYTNIHRYLHTSRGLFFTNETI